MEESDVCMFVKKHFLEEVKLELSSKNSLNTLKISGHKERKFKSKCKNDSNTPNKLITSCTFYVKSVHSKIIENIQTCNLDALVEIFQYSSKSLYRVKNRNALTCQSRKRNVMHVHFFARRGFLNCDARKNRDSRTTTTNTEVMSFQTDIFNVIEHVQC